MDYPTIVYRVPGKWSGNGFTYDTLGVDDESAHGVAREGGWHDSIPLAVAAWQAPKVAAPPPAAPPEMPAVDLVSPPTREEIEAKAKELGIAVHHKNTDETLLKKIEDALKAQAEATPEATDGVHET